MSIKVSAWVWKHSTQRGTLKLLTLALADFANDDGICWPSARTLASCLGETERHTRQLLKQLLACGDIIASENRNGGRGHTTRYGVAVGLNEKQRSIMSSKLANSVIQNTVLQNTVIPQETVSPGTVFVETVISSDINSVLQSQETVISGDPVEKRSSAVRRAKPRQKPEEIRHVDPSIDPSCISERESRSLAQADEHKNMMGAYQQLLNYKIPNGKQEGAAAKKLIAEHYTIAQVRACYEHLKAQPFYAERHVSLQTVYNQIGAYMTASKSKSNGRVTHEKAERPTTSEQLAARDSAHGAEANARALAATGSRPERAPLRRLSRDIASGGG